MKFKELIAFDEEEKAYWDISEKLFPLIIFAVWIIVLNLLAIIYINKSNYIYFWDNATYWDISRNIAKGALLPDFFKNLYASFGSMDYNYTAGLCSAVFIKLFGESRLVYVLTLVNLYLVPSMALVYLIAKRIGAQPILTMSLTMLICPAMTFMAFIGFADVGGLLIAMTCFYLYFKDDKTTVLQYILIGVLLVLSMLWRRWYAFFAVSFITAMTADAIINKKPVWRTGITVAVVGLLLVFVFRDFLVNILLKDYGSIYSGYKFSPSIDFKLITRYFGIIYILLLAASAVYISVKHHDLRPVFMWVQMIVCAVMFMMLQTHGQQHLLLYIPSLIMLTVFTIKYTDNQKILTAIAALAVISAVNVYIPYPQPQNIQDIKIYSPIPSFSMLPREMDNTEEILNLKRRLDEVVGDNETLGVLASSFDINEDILRNAEASFGIKPRRKDYIVTLPQVDSRDTDIGAYGYVNYILLAAPPQTHLAAENQRVVTEAVQSFLNWTDIATAYEEIYGFNTNIGGIELKLFKRVRNIPDYDYRAFWTRFKRN